MSDKRSASICIAATFLVIFGGQGLALAQTGAASGPSSSFFSILIRGAELPGAIIILMSVAALAIVFEHFRTVRRSTVLPEAELDAARELIESRRYKECVAALQSSPSMFANVLLAALRQGRHGYAAMHEAAEETAGVWTNRLQRRAEYLHILGNLGPLMGLLGTVLGMIRAFGKMQEMHGNYKPEDLAGGIGLALVNTFLGLMLAVLALGFFGICRNRIDALTTQTSAVVIELLESFRPTAIAPGVTPLKPPRVEPDAAPKSGIITPGKTVEPVS